MAAAVLLRMRGTEMSPENFKTLFLVAKGPGVEGFYYFIARKNRKVLDNFSSSLGSRWWPRFIYVQQGEHEKTLRSTFRFGKLPRSTVSEEAIPVWLEPMYKLPSDQIYNPHLLVMEPMPYLAGLSTHVPYTGGHTDLGFQLELALASCFFCSSLFVEYEILQL